MPKVLVTRLIRVALAAALTLGVRRSRRRLVDPAVRPAVEFDETGLIASITAGLEAQSRRCASMPSDCAVTLDQVSDLYDVGPTQLDDSPFPCVVLPLAHCLPHDTSLDDTLLFRITGLMAGATLYRLVRDRPGRAGFSETLVSHGTPRFHGAERRRCPSRAR